MKNVIQTGIILLIFPLLLWARPTPWGEGLSKAEYLHFKLVVFGPGDDIPSYWGHIAIIVEDRHFNESAIYNFGLFTFDDHFIFNFLKGRLIFSVGQGNVAAYLSYYRHLNRQIRITLLNIPPGKRKGLAAKLAWYVLPQNRNYVYDHYLNNCSTKLRDLINQAVYGQLRKATNRPGKLTLRQQTRRYVGRNPFLEMLLMFLMNDSIDQPIRQWDEMFLPDELEKHVLALQYPDSAGQMQKLAGDSYIFYRAKRAPTPKQPPLHWPGALLAGIGLAFIGYLLNRWRQLNNSYGPRSMAGLYNLLLGLLLGIPGLALSLFASFTQHQVTYHNENLFQANPLTFLIIFAAGAFILNTKNSVKWLKYLWYFQAFSGLLGLALKVLPAFDQDNWLVIAFILPVNLGMALAWYLADENKNLPAPKHGSS